MIGGSSAARPAVWVDTDVALGAPSGDVDDGYALAALLAAARMGRIDLLGVSTVHGNTTAAESEACARRLCELAGARVEIVRGAEKPGRSSAASDRIAGLPAEVELLCLGPLTNAAAACLRDPSLSARARLSAVGGNLSSIGFLPPLWPFEFNFARDRRSARFALSREWSRTTLYPLDVVARLAFEPGRLEEVAGRGPFAEYLVQQSARWLSRKRLAPRRALPIWDLPAALDVAGLLDGARETRPLAVGARLFLGTRRSFRCLVGFEARSAWGAFLALIENAPF